MVLRGLYGGLVTGHMTPEQFRAHGHEVVDWVADHMGRVESLPVRSQVAPGDVRAALPASAPEQGEPIADVLADLDRIVVPGLTHWQHPGFFGYFPANTSGASVLGDLVSSALGVQGMSWVTSPACTELEQHVMDWFVELLGLPESCTHGSTPTIESFPPVLITKLFSVVSHCSLKMSLTSIW